MRQRLSLLWVMAMVATLLLGGVLPASSQAVRYDVSSIEHVCLTDDGTNWQQGNVMIRDTLSWQPEGMAGPWEGSWSFIANNGIVRAQAVAQGTGALSGKRLFIEIFDLPPDHPIGNLGPFEVSE